MFYKGDIVELVDLTNIPSWFNDVIHLADIGKWFIVEKQGVNSLVSWIRVGKNQHAIGLLRYRFKLIARKTSFGYIFVGETCSIKVI
jgi:hypothetical protein